MSIARHHAEWLSLVEASGPFVSMAVLARVFPQGLDDIDSDLRARLRSAHEEWRDDVEAKHPDVAVHNAWIRYVFREALGYDEGDVVAGDRLALTVPVPEQHEVLTPSFAIVNPDGRDDAGKPRLLIATLPASQDPNKPLPNRFWKVSPVDRMLFLLRGAQALGSKVRAGIVTNGDEWVLVHVAPNETATYVTWSSELLFDEPLTLRAFHSLLGQKRLFGVADSEVLEALFEASSKDQHDVTDQLGLQVRRAVEILVQTIDRLDRDRGRVLLKGIPEATLYESAVTVMMRLVFLFAAEEKKLLLLGTPLYDENYAVSTLHDQLQATADRHGEEVLERRHDGWSRLLATFRAVFGGIDHTDLRLPAYGGSLFDPDRFPFLEGRTPGTSWRDPSQHTASPLAVDNRTVLHLLRALQRLQIRFAGGGPAETRRLSFRALDIEQIGHVYEGLLDHTAKRASGLTVSLTGKKEPEIAVADLEAMRKKERDAFPGWLADATGRSVPAIEKDLQYRVPKDDERRWLAVCDSRRPVYERVAPWAGLIRDDSHGDPVVIDEGAVYVTEGSDRRSTGTHYTPRSLTEPIIQHTLDPLVYDGPAEGKPREDWVLKPPKDILALRVCDLAMGSGAFLVQACRYLSRKLVEGWETAEKNAGDKLVLAPNGELSKGKPGDTLVPREVEERLVLARRFVADRCLYGVDLNPMAVEMAKLSLWLVTLQKNRPFSFVDHALRCGDSLLGVASEDQLLYFHLDPKRGKKLHDNLLGLDEKMKTALDRSRKLRVKLESFPVRDISDSKQKAWLFEQANEATEDLRAIGDLLIGTALATAGKKEGTFDDALRDVSPIVAGLLNSAGGDRARRRGEAVVNATALLNAGREEGRSKRRPFHWAVEFPEVTPRGGFDALVGNPPFMGGLKLETALGTDYRAHIVEHLADSVVGVRGTADLCAYFLLRIGELARSDGHIGILATNTISQGDSCRVGLERMTEHGFVIKRATPSRKWPGAAANLEIAELWLCRGPWSGERIISDERVAIINPSLTAMGRTKGRPRRLAANTGKAFIGSYVLGLGFMMIPGSARSLIADDPANRKVLFPYVSGQDLNSNSDQSCTRWVINFRDWPLNRKRAPVGYDGPVAADFPACLAIVRDLVKPERDSLIGRNSMARKRGETWWRYAGEAKNLYVAIRGMKRVLVRARVSNTDAIAFVSSAQIFSDNIVVFGFDSGAPFSLLQAFAHSAWTVLNASSMRTDVRYTPTDCFETFPFPYSSKPAWETLESVGDRYDTHRSGLMLSNQEGLTKTYNRFHSPDEKSGPIKKLRALHVEMDEAVKQAYGWGDLSLDHGFHETRQGLRYTISETARVEVLDRLLELNHLRYAEEVKAGLHEEGKAKSKPATASKGGKGVPKGRKRKGSSKQPGLFGEDGEGG